VRDLLAVAARAARYGPGRILAVAIAVSLVTVLADIALVSLIAHSDGASAAGELISTALAVLGSVFLSGFVCRVVASAEHRLQRAPAGQVAKNLQWSRLIRADLLVVVFVVLGLIALVVPGLIALTLLCIIGPVIEIEHKPVWAAARRCAHLVRLKFWWMLLLATLPLVMVSEIESFAPEPHSVGAALEALAVRGLGTGVLQAVIGLVLVELAYHLIALGRLRTTPKPRSDSQLP
jgi:hypothetical protein